MKKTYIIGISIFLIAFFSSCSDWLSTQPESEIILEEYWRTESDVQAMVASCYKRMTEEDIMLRMMIWGELRSDNITTGQGFTSGYKDIGKILEGDITSYNAYAGWGGFYSVINYCNTILHYSPIVTERDKNFTQEDLLRTQGEVRAIRALCYFYLVRAFKEVPWIEDASIADTQDYDKPKVSEEEMLGHIIDDLEFAKVNAPTDYGRKDYNKGRVTKSMVYSLLADVYLWKQDYSLCLDACSHVLEDPNLKLETGTFAFSRIFYNGNSSESIFELQFKENSINNDAVAKMYGSSSIVTGFVSFPTSLAYNSYDKENSTGIYSPFNYKVTTTVIESEDDVRAKDSYWLYSGNYYIFKYAGLLRTENNDKTANLYVFRTNPANWIIYRLSDVMLMAAEALVQLTNSNTNYYSRAMELINEVYLRSNTTALELEAQNYATKGEMEKLVLRERQRELLFEGKRWFDLVRVARRAGNTNDINTYMDHKAAGANASLGVPVLDALYMPIANSEIKANPKLKQNSYYKEVNSTNR
ncbi:MAG: RagB/SusD family nutrient uptake outer membrane protein [Paludibacteraceae bacterium]